MINGSSISSKCRHSNFFFGLARTLPIISNKKMEDIIKIVEALEKSGLLIKGVTEAIKTKK